MVHHQLDLVVVVVVEQVVEHHLTLMVRLEQLTQAVVEDLKEDREAQQVEPAVQV